MRDDIDLNLIELLTALTILGMVAVVGTAIVTRYYYDGMDLKTEFQVYPIPQLQDGDPPELLPEPGPPSEADKVTTNSWSEPIYSAPTPFYEFHFETRPTVGTPSHIRFGDLDQSTH